MGRLCHLLDVVVRQDNTGAGFNMRRKYHLRFVGLNGFYHVVDGAWRERRRRAVALHLRFHHCRIAGQIAAFDNLAPAVGEPAIAHDQHICTPRKLTRDGLHPVGAAPGDHCHGIGVVYVLEQSADVTHDLLKHGAHMVQGPVGEHDRKLFKPFRVN